MEAPGAILIGKSPVRQSGRNLLEARSPVSSPNPLAFPRRLPNNGAMLKRKVRDLHREVGSPGRRAEILPVPTAKAAFTRIWR